MELEHEQRQVKFYPQEFNSWANQMPARTRYYAVDNNGEVFLDINKIGEDLDLISDDCEDCLNKGNCKTCKAKYKAQYDPALHAGGADPYTEAISRGLQGAGQLAQAFKANPDPAFMRTKLKQAKAGCPKKPFLRITKKQKAQAQAAEDCIAQATKDEQAFELAVIAANKEVPGSASRMAANPTPTPPANKMSPWAIAGIVAGILVLLTVIIILFIRSRKKAKA